jgi:thiol-disulfide isomerase/thioredoxin
VGRLQALILTLCATGAVACADEAPSAGSSRSRSDAVLTSASPSTKTTADNPRPSATAAPKARKLCETKPAAAGNELPTEKVARIGPGNDKLAETIETGGGKWTWVNLWAGWCIPCKEEMPLLLEWQKKLSSGLRVAFVSIDDDLRLADKFLATLAAPSYHLPAEERDAWLEGVGLGASTKLPSHVLFDPEGKVRCVVKGAIEPHDYAELEGLVKNGK